MKNWQHWQRKTTIKYVLLLTVLGLPMRLLYRHFSLGRHLELETLPEGVRLRIGSLVAFYSLDKHCAGWFMNTILHCPDSCVIHLLPTYHVVRMWDYDRKYTRPDAYY